MKKDIIFILALLGCVVFQAISQGAYAKRVALVIGNDAYEQVAKLEKAVNDAKAVAATLQGLGFEVFRHENLKNREMNRAIFRDFLSIIQKNDEVLFYFAGHGIAVRGRNYLLATDIPKVKPGNERFITTEAFAVDEILAAFEESNSRVSILILDACRNNPFPKEGQRSLGSTRGLVDADLPKGSFVMFSAGARQAALDRLDDNDPHPNSVYTRKLLPLLKSPGLALTDMAKQLRGEVEALALTVSHDQYPAYYDQLRGKFYFISKGIGGDQPVKEQVAVAPPPKAPNVNEKYRADEALLGLTRDDIDNLRVVAEVDFQVSEPGKKSHDELRSVVAQFNAKHNISAGEFWTKQTQVLLAEQATALRKNLALATQDLIKISHSARALVELGYIPKTRKKKYSNGVFDQSYRELTWALDVIFEDYPYRGSDLTEAVYAREFLSYLKKYQVEKHRSYWQGYFDPTSLEELSAKSLTSIKYEDYNTHYRDNLPTKIIKFTGASDSYWTFADWTYWVDLDNKAIPELRCAIYFSVVSNSNDLLTPLIAYNPSKNKRRISDRFHILYYNHFSSFNRAGIFAKKALETGYVSPEDQQKYFKDVEFYGSDFSADGKDSLILTVDDVVVYQGKKSSLYDQKPIDKIINAFQKGKVGRLYYWSAYTGKIEDYYFSLQGFSSAYKYALSKRCP